MEIFVLGVNHQTAPVTIRERVAVPEHLLPQALHKLIETSVVNEGLILSTCNRTEIYYTAESDAQNGLVGWLDQFNQLEPGTLQPYLYHHEGDDAILHLLRVACGLDSMVLGEPQILGQLKRAFALAREADALDVCLTRLLQHSFSVAKKVRTDTDIGQNAVSVAFAAVSLARQLFSSFSSKTVLLVGAGETIELVATHMVQNRVGDVLVANRTLARAEALGEQFNGKPYTLEALPELVPLADIIISSTASPLPVIGKGMVERALKIRKHRPILIIDLAVPRDIEPQVVELDDAFLYSVDDLQQIIQQNMKQREQAAEDAEAIVRAYVSEFKEWLNQRSSATLIRALREQMDDYKEEVLVKATKKLENGANPQEVAQFIAHTLTQKFLHYPTMKIRQATTNADQALLNAAEHLFGMND
ncbi:MAG: glutamyl-tRNA reductase [Kangiellaceae bacterium]|nr:glutamyl-tRNA reductase [Kangiellaceae bacterium]